MDELRKVIAVSDVLLNVYGTRDKRVSGLKKAGYTADECEEIQLAVNKTLSDDKEAHCMAVACIADHYGKNPERAKRLGKWADRVQARINAIYDMRGKTVGQAAKDVINGNYGNDSVRELLLKFCGYDAQAVQDKVNEIYEAEPVASGTKFRVHAEHFFRKDESQYGDCTAIYQYASDGSVAKCVLIDCAKASASSVVIEDLKAQGVKQIDAVVLSHAHGDHYGGLSKILKAFTVKWLYLPDTTELDKYQKGYGNALRRQAKKVRNHRYLKQGESFVVGEIQCKCIFICPANELDEHDSHHFVNNESMQLRFALGKAIFNSGGDMSNPANRVMVKKGIKFRAHIGHLKWHTDGNATNDVWLDGITDGIVLVDADGKKVTTLFKSDYHHNERSGRGGVRKKCEAKGGVVYRNSEDGHIYYDIAGDTITVITTKSKKKDVYKIVS